jgi:hypothetical protein
VCGGEVCLRPMISQGIVHADRIANYRNLSPERKHATFSFKASWRKLEM